MLRSYIGAVVDRLYPNPIVRSGGSTYVDVTLMRKDGRTLVNLVNTAGPHADPNVQVFDEVPPIGPLSIDIRVEHKPKVVSIEPGNRKASWSYEDGCVRVAIDRLEIHDVVALEL